MMGFYETICFTATVIGGCLDVVGSVWIYRARLGDKGSRSFMRLYSYGNSSKSIGRNLVLTSLVIKVWCL
jgi:hypothetical protein